MQPYNNTLVELHVPDFQQVKDYYIPLGFEIVWERPPEGFKGYLVMKMENNILCFWAGNDHVYEHEYFSNNPKDTKRGYGVELVIMVDDVDSYYKSLPITTKVVEKLADKPWGLRDFRIEDPFGYYIRITTYHDILDPKFAVK